MNAHARSTRARASGRGVLFVTRVGFFGGSAASLRTLLRALDPTIPRVLVAPRQGPLAEALIDEGLVTSAALFSQSDAGRLGGVITMLRVAARTFTSIVRARATIAVVHANGLADAVCAAPAALLTNRRLVVWVHDDDPSRRRSRHAARLVSRLGRSRVRWIAVSRPSRDALIRAAIARPEQVEVVGNPIESSGEPPFRPTGPVRIGFFGTDTPRKGFDLLPEVALGLDGIDAQLLVFARHHIGLDESYEAIWRELEANEQVELVGRLDDVDEGYRRCDVVFCPSRIESFCRVAAEAMRHGIPVVASALDPIKELLGDDEAGLVFPPGDAQTAAATLRTVAGDADLRRAMGTRGIERSRQFDPRRIAGDFERIYGLGEGSHGPEPDG